MTKIETFVKSTVTKEDLKVFADIRDGLDIFRNLYERLTWVNNNLEFAEYNTLQNDFQSFYAKSEYNQGNINLHELQSLKRSFELLYDRLLTILPRERTMIKTFVSECIIRLRTIISQLTEAKTLN